MSTTPRPQVAAGKPTVPASWGIFVAEIWMLFSAWCSLSGWGLSLCGWLNTWGYAAAFVTGCVFFGIWLRRAEIPRVTRPPWKSALTLWAKRFRKPLPFLFLAAAILCLVDGILYAPANYDALTYRLPRTFQWLAESHWHWIATLNSRMNYSGAGFEWLMVPLILFTRGVRFLFLLNFIPWLLLPGAVFACLREMGVGARVAWHWMWLFPLGDCYVLQAGGIANDSYAALYVLLSVSLALKAQRTRRLRYLWSAALAAALCTGSKASNIPLLLPFFIAAWPARGLILSRKAGSVCVALACLAVSFLPLAILNWVHTGGWTGDPTNEGQMELKNPVAAFAGNALQLTIHNLEPPVMASTLNGVIDRFSNLQIIQSLKKDFPRLSLDSGELPQEEGAGMGVGLAVLFLTSLIAWVPLRRSRGQVAPDSGIRRFRGGYLITLGAWVALSVYMAKMGSEAGPRLVAAYYPLCLALALLHPGNAALLRRRWWRVLSIIASLSIFPALILDPARPLWPALTLLRALPESLRQKPALRRVETVYKTYASRPILFDPLASRIPPGVRFVGFLGMEDDPSTSLWLPLGSRRVIEFFAADENSVINICKGDKFLLVASRAGIENQYGMASAKWIQARGARIIASDSLRVKIHRGPEDWYLLELPMPGAGGLESRDTGPASIKN